MLVLYEFLFLNPGSLNPSRLFLAEPRRLRKYIPLAILFLAYIALRMILFPRMVTGRLGAAGPAVSPYAYLLTQFRAWIYYIRLFLWPHPLMIDFASFGWSHSLWDSRVLLSLGLVLGILTVAWVIRKTRPIFTFFLFWYFIALLPEASIIPLEDAVVGYRAYPAYVGLAVVSAMLSLQAAIGAWQRLRLGREKNAQSFWLTYGFVAAVVLTCLTAATVVRNKDWRNESTLWKDVMGKDPINPRPYMSLGLESLIQGDYPTAQEFFDKAIQLNPRLPHALILRGYLSFRQDKNQQALADYDAALKLDPRDPYAFFYRGELYRKINESDKALADYNATLRLMPYYTDAYLGMAMAYLDKEDIIKATAACAKLVEIDPEDARGYDCLGTLLVEQNRLSDAIRLYKRGVERNPKDGELWQGLGTAYGKLGMLQEAEDAFAKAGRAMTNGKRKAPVDTLLLY
jgi:tetratricopeptide (TPR) repeat protein